MLGFQYVVAKSRELSSALDRELSAASGRSTSFSPASGASSAETAAPNAASEAPSDSRNEGHEFLRAQQNVQAQAVYNHQKLMLSGQDLDAALARARATLQAQAASEQFLAQNFHLVSRVRQQLAGVRNLVLKLADEADEVENLLVQRCEESAARQNAEFAAQQQQELENFEASIAKESAGRKRELLETRRKKLASAFRNDLRTYQTLVAHHGDAAAAEARSVKSEKHVTLDEVDLVVTADPDQLDAFYDSSSDQEEEPQSPKFSVPKELEEEEEEKSEEKEDDAETVADQEGEAEEVAVETTDGESGEVDKEAGGEGK
ncbi:hypothetical protein PRIC1_011582 [Phytophthora ramorum]